jgi:putative ATP-dependent endonuclease of OLD family
MHITKIRIKNFKRFSGWFELDLSPTINIMVGVNEIGKSTILEAINLALTGFYQGKYVRNEGVSKVPHPFLNI